MRWRLGVVEDTAGRMNSVRHLIHAMKTDMRGTDGYAVPLTRVLLSSTASILSLLTQEFSAPRSSQLVTHAGWPLIGCLRELGMIGVNAVATGMARNGDAYQLSGSDHSQSGPVLGVPL